MFTGTACQQLQCPTDTAVAVNKCSGKGTCRSMSALAQVSLVNGQISAKTYNLWDATMMYGCDCNRHQYHGPLAWDYSDYKAFDCSLFNCPFGDDPEITPTVAHVDEVQSFSCTADGGWFYINFREAVTMAIAYDATASEVRYGKQSSHVYVHYMYIYIYIYIYAVVNNLYTYIYYVCIYINMYIYVNIYSSTSSWVSNGLRCEF
jgi:hypothetical protein